MKLIEKATQTILEYPYAVLNDTALRALLALEFIQNASIENISGHFVDLSINTAVTLKPQEAVLVFTDQYFDMPPYIHGQISIKSRYARQFVDQINSIHIKAGWRGLLLLELVNHGTKTVKLSSGEQIAQVFFTKVPPCEVPYNGAYQDQRGF